MVAAKASTGESCVADRVIENPIINSPYRAPTRQFAEVKEPAMCKALVRAAAAALYGDGLVRE
jgi:hypothetical protein